ncbi:MAG: cytochrome P450 [Ktedonobacteraceae bacterium]|nr:cytochrome P450 [Ktedonobacteraceae bacterium]
MHENETMWQLGASDALLPPSVVPQQTALQAKACSNLKFYVEQHQTLGPIFRVERSDNIVTVMAGPEANTFMARVGPETLSEKAFWQGFDEEYANRENVEREGTANRQRRALLSRSYSRGRIVDRLPTLVEMTRKHSAGWENGQSIAFFSWLQGLVAEQLGQLLTTYGPGDYVADLDTFLSIAIASTLTKTQNSDALQAQVYQRAKQRVFELGRAIVAAHRLALAPDREPDIVDEMIAAATKAGHEVRDEQLALGALGPFLAGLHTVTTAACYLLYALLKHQDVLERVMAEVDAALGKGELSWERVRGMHVLHGAVMEALRLYPVSIGHHCQAMQPFTFASYRVERGDDVFVAMAVSHFLPELFPHPLSFDCDRYHEPRNEHRQRGAYAPFGLGDHSCLGVGIAETQLVVTVATLLFLFQLELDPPGYELRPLEPAAFSVRGHFRIRVMSRRR